MKALKRLNLSKVIRGKVYLTPVYEDDSTDSPLPFASEDAALQYAAMQYPQLPLGRRAPHVQPGGRRARDDDDGDNGAAGAAGTAPSKRDNRARGAHPAAGLRAAG